MWNYSFMVPSLLILFTLLAFYFARRRLPLRLNRTFLGILTIHLYVVLFDFVSSRADELHALFPIWALYALNTMFFVAFLMRIVWFYQFTLDVLGLTVRFRRKPATWLLGMPFVVGEVLTVTSFLNGAVFSIDAGGYHRGPLYNVIYVCFFFYIGLSLLLICLNAGQLNRSEFISGIGYNAVLFIGNIARILLPGYLVMNTFCVVAILIIYLAYLNPDLYLSGRGSAFNMRGFRTMLTELAEGRRFHILGFVLMNYSHERSILGGDQMDRAIAQINEYLTANYPDYLAFYLRSGRYAMIGRGNVYTDACLQIQARIQARFQEPWRTDNAEIYLNTAFAYVDSEAQFKTADRILNNLVLALENARQSASMDVAAIPMNAQDVDRQVDIMRSLENAVENGAVEVFLQPVVDSRTRGLVAAEALSRIRDDGGSIIPPGLFIPIAEKNGYINRLGEQVFEKTCAFIRDHDMEALGLEWINVNLSPIQCLQRDLPERLARILKRYEVPAHRIHLEITEQSMIDYAQLKKQIALLQAAGFQFVLDDYGSGYSNLTRVKHYPFINIKLDMEVVWDYFKDRDSLLPNIVQGFKCMNLSITAEGIETEEMADVLTSIGSDYLQGYLFAQPLPMEEFVEKYGK